MKKISKRCGYGDKCPHWDSKSESKCAIYSDRKECSKSLKNRKSTAKTSKRRNLNFIP